MNEKILKEFLNTPEGLEIGIKVGNAFFEALRVFIETISKDLTTKEKNQIEFVIKMTFYDEMRESRELQEQINKIFK